MGKYNSNNIIAQSKAYKTAIDKKKFLENILKETIKEFEEKRETVPNDIINLVLNGKKSTLNLNHSKSTYHDLFINSYSSFVENITKEIQNLNWYVSIENDLNEISRIPNIEEKLKRLYSRQQYYKSNKLDIALLLKDLPEQQKQHHKENKYALKLLKEAIKEIERKPKKKIENNTLSPIDFVMSVQYIERILEKINDLLFDNSDLVQWECVIKNIPPSTPIIIKSNITLKDIRYFFDLLVKEQILIERFLTPIERLNAFYFRNKSLTAKQLKDGIAKGNAPDPKLKERIDLLIE